MRIAVWHNLPSGGGKRALHDYVRGLVERGHHVEVWCPTMADTDYMPLRPYVAAEHVVPLEVKPTPTRTRFQRLSWTYWQAVAMIEAMEEHCRTCGGQIRSGGFDLLFATSCPMTAASPIGRHVDIPSVLYLQEPNRFLYEVREWPDSNRIAWTAPADLPLRMRLKKPIVTPRRWAEFKRQFRMFATDLATAHGYRVRAREELLSARAHRRVLCNSYFSRESMVRTYGIDAKVCYLGVDCDAFRPVGEKRPYVVGLGSLIESKRIEAAMAALATIDGGIRPELVWVGNSVVPDYRRKLEETARALGVEFTFKQLVPQSELVETLASAAVMIYTPMLEPFGYAPLEANACGTAVVGWVEGGVRETIRDGVNGTIVEPGDYEATGRAIQRYVRDLDFARSSGTEARRHVEGHWTLAAAMDRLEANLFEVLAGDHRGGDGARARPEAAISR